jgi:hypothetical protein
MRDRKRETSDAAALIRATLLRKDGTMKRSTEHQFQLVLVEWEDSARPIPAWQWVEDYEIPKTIRCLSVGYLIAETDDAIALAPNLGDIDEPRAQACGIIRIPQRAIIKARKL